jgi:RNA polymerase sigma factor (sigma-70 family)
MSSIPPSARPGKQRRYVAALVLGTALSALGTQPAAAVAHPEVPLRTVQDLSRYCTTCWRNARLDPDCWTDCTQDVFCRLLERVPSEAWDRLLTDDSEEKREFLRAIDTVKKRSQRSRRWSNNLVETVADRRPQHERSLADDRESVNGAAVELLSSRQQQILKWSFEGWSVQDISRKLRVSAERISDEKYKAIRKLRARLNPEPSQATCPV